MVRSLIMEAILYFTVICLYLLALGATADRVPGDVLYYRLPRRECLRGSFVDSSAGGASLFGSLERIKNYTSCLQGLGVVASTNIPDSSAGIISESNASQFFLAMAGQNFTLEFWMHLSVSAGADDSQLPLVTIGSTTDTNSDDESRSIHIYRRKDNNKIYFCSDCDYPVPTSTLESQNGHFVLTVESTSFNTFRWFVDGDFDEPAHDDENRNTQTLSDSWRNFDESHQLQVLGDMQHHSSGGAPLQDRLFSLAVYDFALSAEQVKKNFNAKLPNSPPSLIDIVVSANEDGMAQDYPSNPSLYGPGGGLSNGELAWISLNKGTFDQDEETDYPNYNASDILVRPMKIFVASLPTIGGDAVQLYHYNEPFAEILASDLPVEINPTYSTSVNSSMPTYTADEAIANFGDAVAAAASLVKSYRVRVRPPRNFAGSPAANFSFFAVDGLTSLRSTENATCQIVILPMNDPPEAYDIQTSIAAGLTTIIQLNGSDVDDISPFTSAYISKYPRHAKLFAVSPDGSVTNCSVDDPKANGGRPTLVSYCFNTTTQNVVCPSYRASVNMQSEITCIEVGQVAYKFLNWSSLSPLDDAMNDGVVGADSFEYVLADIHGFNSTAALASIVLTTPLVAFTDLSTESTDEEKPTLLSIKGRDYSPVNRELAVEIVTLPAYGSLKDPSNNRTLQIGDTLLQKLSYPTAQAIHVEYTGDTDYFNSPSTQWDRKPVVMLSGMSSEHDYFQFRVRAIGSSDLSSVPAKLDVKVVNVNDPSELTNKIEESTEFVGKKLSVYAFSSLNLVDDDDFPTQLTLSGLNMSADRDLGVDVVKVAITCTYGVIFINPTNLTDLDFTSSDYCYTSQPLQCKNAYGDGYSSTVFLAKPEDAALAISDMTYRSSIPNREDYCIVSIYDGADDNCLPEDALRNRRSDSMSLYYGPEEVSGTSCFIAAINFTVKVLEYGFQAADDEKCDGFWICLDWRLWVAAVFGICSIICVLGAIAHQRIQDNILRRIGYAVYDSDDDGGNDNLAASRLSKMNDPANWIRIEKKSDPSVQPQSFFYYNIRTGASQWEAPIFTLGPPIPIESLACQGIEDNPATWVAVTTGDGRNYYYNTSSERSSWTFPQFSRKWIIDPDTGLPLLLPLEIRGSRFKSVFEAGSTKENILDGHIKKEVKNSTINRLQLHRRENEKQQSKKWQRLRNSLRKKEGKNETTAINDMGYSYERHRLIQKNGRKRSSRLFKSKTGEDSGSGGESSSDESENETKVIEILLREARREESWAAKWDRTCSSADPASVLGGWEVNGRDEPMEAFVAAVNILSSNSNRECVQIEISELCRVASQQFAILQQHRKSTINNHIADKESDVSIARDINAEEIRDILTRLQRRGLIKMANGIKAEDATRMILQNDKLMLKNMDLPTLHTGNQQKAFITNNSEMSGRI